MNVTNSTNAKKGAKEDFNAYKEFSDIETDALIVAATMTHFNMQKIEGTLKEVQKILFNLVFIMIKFINFVKIPRNY